MFTGTCYIKKKFGHIPISYLVKIRRQMYLPHILSQKEDLAHMKSPTRGYWDTTVLEEIEEIGLHFDLDEIRNMSKNKFRVLVIEKVKIKAFIYILEEKESINSFKREESWV